MPTKLTDAMTSDDKDTKVWKARFNAAKAAYEEADFKTCESLLVRLLEQAKSLKECVFAVNTTKVGLGVLYLASNRADEAEKQLRSVIQTLASSGDQTLEELYAVALRFHAQVLIEKNDEEAAEKQLQEALMTLEKTGPHGAIQLAYVLSDLGAFELRKGNVNEAKEHIFTALDLLETTLGTESPAYMKAEIIYNLCHAENKDDLLNSEEDALLKLQYQYGHKHPDIMRALCRYAKVRIDRGETEKLDEAKARFPMLEKILKH